MTHDVIYEYFRSHFPQYSKPARIVAWFPAGRNAIRVRFEGDLDYVFTYHGDNDWCFETVNSFIRRMKGVRKM